MPDEDKVAKAIEYLNWYFAQDDGEADKDAVDAWEELIKELEPVKPEHGFPDLKCSNCGTEFASEIRCCLWKPLAGYYKHCPGCGREVKWND